MKKPFVPVLPFAAILAVLFVLRSAPAFAQDPRAVLNELQQQYEQVETLRASFTQTVHMPYEAAPMTATGELTLQGERYRVEMPDQTIVADGETTWIYMHDENQVLINDYEEDESTFSPSHFFLQFDERYLPLEVEDAAIDGTPYIRLVLENDDPATMFVNITVWIREDDRQVRRIDVVDVNDTEITFELDDVTLNPPVDEDVFVFTPPEGVEVIDLRT